MAGFGAVVSFDVEGGAARADAVCRSVRIIRHATSLGGVESTIERRAAIPGQSHLPPDCCGSASGANIPTTSGGTSNRPLRRDAACQRPDRPRSRAPARIAWRELRDAGVTNELNLQGWLGARNLRLVAADPREPEISPALLDRRAP